MSSKISELPAATSVASVDTIVIVQSGVTKKATVADLGSIVAADRSTVTALSITTGVVDIDYSLGDYFTLALTANVTSLTFSNLPGAGKGATLMFLITQDTTAKTLAWPASFKWEGTAPAVSTASGAKDLLAISTFDNGTTWHATLSKGRA